MQVLLICLENSIIMEKWETLVTMNFSVLFAECMTCIILALEKCISINKQSIVSGVFSIGIKLEKFVLKSWWTGCLRH